MAPYLLLRVIQCQRRVIHSTREVVTQSNREVVTQSTREGVIQRYSLNSNYMIHDNPEASGLDIGCIYMENLL